ncbi:MAG: NAD(P)H-hydrate dehydratase [Kiritimatiellae bacterium]|nr:NAD(P)H-hydrate dehydratase [Kiritimatiellia bacterium]
MKFLTVDQMRAADRAAVSECNIPEQVLMNRAGAALAYHTGRVARLRGVSCVTLIAGHGNNGGDAFVAARYLHRAGFNAHVLMTCTPSTLKGAARIAWDEMQSEGLHFEVLAAVESWQAHPDRQSGSLLNHGIVVDGVLGTGCSGEPRSVAAAAIDWINSARPHALVVAVDLPSGMHGDTGAAAGAVVKADITVTFAAPKKGFCNPAAMALLGNLIVADIGIPDAIAFRSDAGCSVELIAQPELSAAFHRRAWDSHKGSCGHLCVIGGAEPYPNAPILTAAGALRSGAGLVTLWGCAATTGGVALIPEAICRRIVLDDFCLCGLSQRLQEYRLDHFDAIVVGPGLTRSTGAQAMVRYVLEKFKGWIVIDADGLNILAELSNGGYQLSKDLSLVITPHPGEAARLLGCSVPEVQEDRAAAVKSLAARYNAIAVLKGAGTLVCDCHSKTWLNLTGNPGMATAGMGDVLAGMIGSLLAQGLEATLAVTLAVWAHGTAGDLAAIVGSQTSLTAMDLVNQLPAVFQGIER